MSISVYNPTLNLCRQTWVDESGSYWHFVGSLVNGDPSFGTPEPVDADRTYKRMACSNITPETFDWRWESSPDQQKWTENWAIAYVHGEPGLTSNLLRAVEHPADIEAIDEAPKPSESPCR